MDELAAEIDADVTMEHLQAELDKAEHELRELEEEDQQCAEHELNGEVLEPQSEPPLQQQRAEPLRYQASVRSDAGTRASLQKRRRAGQGDDVSPSSPLRQP